MNKDTNPEPQSKVSSVDAVKEFHQVFSHEIGEKPQILSLGNLEFRKNFILEELKELEEAVANNDIVGVADALGDLQYVLDGAFLNCGLHNYKDAIIEEIHTSNMTKVCKTEEQLKISMDWFKQAGIEVYYESVEDYHIIKRLNDNKVLKPIGYKSPNLKKVLGL